MNDQQKKSNKNLMAIASLICGVISVLPVIFFISGFFLPYELSEKISDLIPLFLNIIVFLIPPVALLGLILGIKGLRFTKLAIVGIVFSIIGLGMFMILILFALWYQFIIYPAPGFFK